MNLTIETIFTNSILPNGEMFFVYDSSKVVYLEIYGDLIIEWKGSEKLLKKKDKVVGKKFRLKNNSSNIVQIRGILIQINDDNFNFKPITISDHEFHGHLPKTRELSDAMRSLFNDLSRNAIFNFEKKFSVFFRTVLNEKYTSSNSIPTGKIDSRLLKVHRFLRKNYSKPITLQQLGEMVQSNPIYLCTIYTKTFRISPIKHLQHFRMSIAENKVVNSDLTIKEIANQLGYISNSQFINLFKRYHGVTPNQMRKQTTIDSQ